MTELPPPPTIGHIKAGKPYWLEVWWKDGARRGRVENIDFERLVVLGDYRTLRYDPVKWSGVRIINDGHGVSWDSDGLTDCAATTLQRLAEDQARGKPNLTVVGGRDA